jgi:hypothetical protein
MLVSSISKGKGAIKILELKSLFYLAVHYSAVYEKRPWKSMTDWFSSISVAYAHWQLCE